MLFNSNSMSIQSINQCLFIQPNITNVTLVSVDFTVCTEYQYDNTTPSVLRPSVLRPSVLRPSHRTRKHFQRETPQFKGEHGRNLRESNRGGIPLPGRTDVQQMPCVNRRDNTFTTQVDQMFGNACVYNKKMNPRGCQQSCGSHQGSSMMRVRQDRRDRFSHDKSRTQIRTQDSGSATTQDPSLDRHQIDCFHFFLYCTVLVSQARQTGITYIYSKSIDV